ncbi:beta strand repeat-containing protein [Stieleria varia]|uniref:Uncharacterized protein n=1 Tax=Stieleria varia TaxID=2528005 RepID=A0A5C6B283_9BACT|nr:hypothetical protein [Stieleria varia]TWU05947.1 hypothetical protein Pla52n_16630 [Stieleria varia]
MINKLRSLAKSKPRQAKRRKLRRLEQLEARLNLATAAVVLGELRIDGLVTENNNMTVDYAADLYTITDTNPLTLTTPGAGMTQVNANTVTIDGSLVTDRVRVNMRDGMNTVTINGNGGSGWGDEGLRVNNDTRTDELTIIGSGGVNVQTGAGRGQVEILTDLIELGGDIETSDNNLIEFGTDTGDTVDVTNGSFVGASTGAVTFNGPVSSANSSSLGVEGGNVQFLSDATGLDGLSVLAFDLAIFAGNVGSNSSSIEGNTQVSIAGTLTSDTAVLTSPDLNLSTVMVDDLTIEGGALDISGAVAPNVLAGSEVTLRSRVAGNPITVFNTASSPTAPDSLVIDATDIAQFSGYEHLTIGGQKGVTQTSLITLVNNGLSASNLSFPMNASLIAQTIDVNEGIDAGGNTTEFEATTLNLNNGRAFTGLGNIVFEALPAGQGGDGSITVNGRALAVGANVPTLTIAAVTSATILSQMSEFSSIEIEAPTASFNSGISAMTSRGDISFNMASAAGVFGVAGGLFATGSVSVNGDLDLLGDSLLFARGGGAIDVMGNVIGNGNALEIRGLPAMPASLVSLGGASDLARFSVLHNNGVVLGGTIDVNVPGGDVIIRTNGNLSIGGDILSADNVDLIFSTADLAGGDRLIDSIADSRVQLIGDFAGAGTLTVDAGQYIRGGADGGVTIVVV